MPNAQCRISSVTAALCALTFVTFLSSEAFIAIIRLVNIYNQREKKNCTKHCFGIAPKLRVKYATSTWLTPGVLVTFRVPCTQKTVFSFSKFHRYSHGPLTFYCVILFRPHRMSLNLSLDSKVHTRQDRINHRQSESSCNAHDDFASRVRADVKPDDAKRALRYYTRSLENDAVCLRCTAREKPRFCIRRQVAR